MSETGGSSLITHPEGNPAGLSPPEKELEKLVSKMENEERAIIIDHRFHRTIIGTKGVKIKEIRNTFNKVRISFPEPGKQSDIVKIRGPNTDVDQCFKFLNKMLRELHKTNYQVKVSIPRKFHKFIIGKGGANIKKIRKETDTRIELPSKGQKSDEIIITGKKEKCDEARDCIEKIHEKLAFLKEAKENVQGSKARIQQRANDLEIVNLKVYIPQKYLGIMLSALGSKKQEFTSKFKVYINFPKNDSGSLANCQKNQGQLNKNTPVRPLNIINIMGSKKRCEAAREALLSLMPVTVKENIAFRHHCFIAGKEGEKINKMRAKYKVTVDVPPAEEQSDIIKITGLPANIERAREALREKVRQLEVKELEVEVDPKYYPKIIWMKGAVISKLRDKYNVSIQFPPCGNVTENGITITGCEENVQEAKVAITEKLDKMVTNTVEIDSGMQFHPIGTMKFKNETAKAQVEPKASTEGLELFIEDTISVAVKHHRHFISRRCEVLHQISDQYGGVTISFPWSNVQRDKVTLKGVRKCVEGAKARILEIVNDLEEKVNLGVIIPQKYHHTVMGARGCRVRALTAEFKVQIKFPKKDSSYLTNTEEIERHLNSEVNNAASVRLEDIVRIIGKRDRCEAARDALINLVPITVNEKITMGFYRFITEENGKNAINMMKKYFVNILVPPAWHCSKFLTITGLPANTACAREAVREKVFQLDNEALDHKARRPFQFRVEVDPEYYPKIIGKKGSVISEIKDKYDVNIHGDVYNNIITITGFKEKNVLDATETIFAMTRDFGKMVKYTSEIGRQVHSRLSRGRVIKRIMKDCEVKIKFPPGDGDKKFIVITGTQENIEKCKNCLLNLMEEYRENIIEKEVMEEYIWLSHHRDPSMVVLAVKNKQR